MNDQSPLSSSTECGIELEDESPELHHTCKSEHFSSQLRAVRDSNKEAAL
jgi:hypothetical protein